MKRSVFAAVLAASLVSGSMAAAQDSETTKVGLITTLSGGGAAVGADIRDGFMLAIEQSGMKNIEVIVEDDEQKPDVAVRSANKLLQSDKVDVLTGIIFSNLAMAVIPSTVAQGNFYLSPNAGPSALAGKDCNPLYFNVAWQNDNIHEAGGAHATDQGYKKILLLAPNYPAGVDALNGFKRLYKGDVTKEIMTKFGQQDYANEIAQIRASDADGVYFFLPAGMGIAFLKQYADSGVKVPLIGPSFSFDQTILGAVGDAALGVHNTAQWSKDLDNEANIAFVKTFQEKFGRLPSLYASQSFDTGSLLVSAVKQAKVSDKEAFRKALEKADFASTRGKFKFNTNHHPIQDIYVREVIKEGDVYTNKIIGTALTDHGDAFAAECKM